MVSIVRTRWTPKELLHITFPELDWIVPNLLPEGFSILGGRPKVGKSWLAMQITQAIISGGQVFGQKVTKGKVFYLALEDNGRRLARRMRQQHWPDSNDCVFVNQWKPLNVGGLDDLDKEFTKAKYRLCVVDTVSRAFQVKDTNDLGNMTKAYSQTQHFFENHGISLLAIDHHNKAGAGEYFDPIDSIIASTAKVAVPDTILGLARGRGKKKTHLVSLGREMEEFDQEIFFDSLTMCWQLSGTDPRTLKGKIVEAARAKGAPVFVTELAKLTGKRPEQVSRELTELVREGILEEGQKQGTFVPYLLKTRILQ